MYKAILVGETRKRFQNCGLGVRNSDRIVKGHAEKVCEYSAISAISDQSFLPSGSDPEGAGGGLLGAGAAESRTARGILVQL